MSHTYLKVRQAIYKKFGVKVLKKKRSFKEAWSVLSLSGRILLILLMIFAFLTAYFVFFHPTTYHFAIPSISVVILIFIISYRDEKMYNPTRREQEIALNDESICKNNKEVIVILKEQNLFTTLQVNYLIEEANARLSQHKNIYKPITSLICSYIIILPITTLISQFLSKNPDIYLPSIKFLLIIGIISLILFHAAKVLIYYVCEYHKDEIVLKFLSDIKYHKALFDNN